MGPGTDIPVVPINKINKMPATNLQTYMEICVQEVTEFQNEIAKTTEEILVDSNTQPKDVGGLTSDGGEEGKTHAEGAGSKMMISGIRSKDGKEWAAIGGEEVKGLIDEEGFQRKKLKTSPKCQMAGRSSSRVEGTGTPIPLRAERRAAWADNKGTNHNSFSVLQNIDNEVLAKVARVCNINLGETEEEVDACIDLIKAKELAQATLAEAEKKKEVGKEREVSAILVESDDEQNDEHEHLLHELEGADTISEEVHVLEVNKQVLKGSILDKPK